MFSVGKAGCGPPILVNDNRTRKGGRGFAPPQIFGPAMNLSPIRSTPRQMPQNAAKRRKTPQNTAEHRRTPQNTAEHRRTPQNATEFCRTPQNATEHRRMPQNAAINC
jgi:hypothetical protein